MAQLPNGGRNPHRIWQGQMLGGHLQVPISICVSHVYVFNLMRIIHTTDSSHPHWSSYLNGLRSHPLSSLSSIQVPPTLFIFLTKWMIVFHIEKVLFILSYVWRWLGVAFVFRLLGVTFMHHEIFTRCKGWMVYHICCEPVTMLDSVKLPHTPFTQSVYIHTPPHFSMLSKD